MVGNGQRAHSECMLCQAASHIYLISCHSIIHLSGASSSTSQAALAIHNKAVDCPHRRSRQAQSQTPTSPAGTSLGIRPLGLEFLICTEPKPLAHHRLYLCLYIWKPHHPRMQHAQRALASPQFDLKSLPLPGSSFGPHHPFCLVWTDYHWHPYLIAAKFAWLVVWPASPCSGSPYHMRCNGGGCRLKKVGCNNSIDECSSSERAAIYYVYCN